MADRSLRGMRLGAQSLQSEDGVVFSERAEHQYTCTVCDRVTTVTFAADAEAPEAWECRTCGEESALTINNAPVVIDHSGDKVARTHWDMLLERRTREDLQELLDERLEFLRARRGTSTKQKIGA